MARDLGAALAEFDADDKTPRLIAQVMKIVPKAPEYVHADRIKRLMQQLHIDPSPMNMNRLASAVRDERVSDALWMASVLDTGDKGYSVLTGAGSAVKLFFGGQRRAFDFDRAQRNDAVLKALGLSYMIHKAIPGSIPEKVSAFKEMESGQQLIAYYAGIEIALPFADNLARGTAGFVDRLFKVNGAAQAGRLAGMAGEKTLDGVRGVLKELTGTIQDGVNRAQDSAPQLAEAARRVIPSMARGVDAATGIAAQAADLMPVYRVLGARFVGEATIRRAIAD